MKLTQLRALITVADKGSIHEAARALHVTQPAITKALRDLEVELGTPLLLRSANGARLTTYGLALLRRARVIEQELRYARNDLDLLLGVANGTLTIGVTPVTANLAVAQALKTFVHDYPAVIINVLELRPADIQNGVADGTLDFGVISRVGEPDAPRLHWETLYTTPTSLAVRRAHPLRGPCTLATLMQQHAWLIWDAIDDASSPIGSILEHYAIAPPSRLLRCTSTTLYREMSVSTDLISLWAESVFDQPARARALRKITLAEALPDMTVGLVCRNIELMTSIAAQLISLIRGAAHEIAGHGRRAP
jgi:DNA-binding transcriptional LysR family regulator